MNTLTARLKKLQLKEDEFNRNAALVPENDPNISLINDKIQLLKESVEKLSADRGDLMSELKKISEIRNAKFLEFFDKAASNVENIYQALTTKDSQLG
jgi:chromosome segregation ATPase